MGDTRCVEAPAGSCTNEGEDSAGNFYGMAHTVAAAVATAGVVDVVVPARMLCVRHHSSLAEYFAVLASAGICLLNRPALLQEPALLGKGQFIHI